MLEVNDVSLYHRPRLFRRRETAVLSGVSLSVPEGHAIAIIGHSGSGKTSLLRMMAGDRFPFVDSRVHFNTRSNHRTRYKGEITFGDVNILDVKVDPDVLRDLHVKVMQVDEAYAGLGVAGAERAKYEVGDWKERGVSVVFATHNLPAVADAVDKIVHMSGGKIVWEGPVEDLRGQSGDSLPEETLAYLRAVKRVYDWEP